MRDVSLAPRWQKALRDIVARPGRSTLVILALTAGVFEAGAMLAKYAILTRELETTFRRTQPASARILVDAVSDALLDSVRAVPGVADAEARALVPARVRVGPDQWAAAALFVVRDFDDQRIDVFGRDVGAWPPAEDQVLIERASLPVAQAIVGDTLTLRLAGGGDTRLEVAGTVHAAGLAPGWMDHVVVGFVGWRSPLRRAESMELRITVAGDRFDRRHIREVAGRVAALLARGGHAVPRIVVPEPGRHPHADQMDAFTFLIGAFGLLTFLLGTVLAATMIHALLIEQVRQVGVMKAIGASTRQVTGIYLAQVLVLALASLVLGIPLGMAAGRGYARFAASILNADIADASVPLWVFATEIAAGLIVPLLVALVPVLRASRVTVRAALHDDPVRPFGVSRIERWLASVGRFPRPFLLSLRATFMRRARLALTVGTMAAGGAVFMSALNVSGAWDHAVDRDFATRRYDVGVRLSRPQPLAALGDSIAAIPGVARVESWADGGASLGADGLGGPRLGLVGPEPQSALLALPVVAGRWLRPEDRTGAVINRAVQTLDSTLRVGGDIALLVNGRSVTWPIVGVVKELSPHLAVYAPAAAVRAATGAPDGTGRTLLVVTRRHDPATQLAVAEALQRAFERMGIEVDGIQRTLDARKAILDHLVIVKTILTLASIMVVFVGGLALASMLSLGVVQRTREIGILSAIGAGPRAIARQVWLEALLVALMSWVVAVGLAAPVSLALEDVCGRIFFKAPLDFFMSPAAAAIWLVLVAALASLGSIPPARHAARLTIREALAYE
jgi:putative ABC transport system permease protein